MSKLSVCVLFGGMSPEHEVSLRSAESVLNHLDPEKYNIFPVGITKQGEWILYGGKDYSALPSGQWRNHENNRNVALSPVRGQGLLTFEGDCVVRERVDVVFPVLHGENGEDGSMQGLLQLAGIAYVGPHVASSATCMDKTLTKLVADNAGIRQAAWRLVTADDMKNIESVLDAIEKGFEYPVFVKPAGTGSSVGVAKAKTRVVLQHRHGPHAHILVHAQKAPDALGQQLLHRFPAALEIVDAHADGGPVQGDHQLLAGFAEAGETALVDDVAQIVAQQRGGLGVGGQHGLGEGEAAAQLVVVRLDGGLARVLGGQGAQGGEGDVPADQQLRDGILLHGAGQDHAVHLPVVQGPDQGGVVRGRLQADHDIVAQQEALVHDGAHGLTDEGHIQLDEIPGQHQSQIVGPAFRQALGGGVGLVVVFFDVCLDPLPGGGGDSALSRDGPGYGGFGNAQLPGDIVNGKTRFDRHSFPSDVDVLCRKNWITCAQMRNDILSDGHTGVNRLRSPKSETN